MHRKCPPSPVVCAYMVTHLPVRQSCWRGMENKGDSDHIALQDRKCLLHAVEVVVQDFDCITIPLEISWSLKTGHWDSKIGKYWNVEIVRLDLVYGGMDCNGCAALRLDQKHFPFHLNGPYVLTPRLGGREHLIFLQQILPEHVWSSSYNFFTSAQTITQNFCFETATINLERSMRIMRRMSYVLKKVIKYGYSSDSPMN